MKNLSSSISSGLQVEVASFIVEDILLSLMRHASKEEVKKLTDSPKLATTAEFADWVGQANCVVVLACCVPHHECAISRARLFPC